MTGGWRMGRPNRQKSSPELITAAEIACLGDSMQIGYLRVSKADGSQSTDLQRDSLVIGHTDNAARRFEYKIPLIRRAFSTFTHRALVM